jgi:hypothetical protein
MSALRVPALMLGLGLAASSACGPKYEIAMGPLAGKIGGAPWTVATAATDPVLSNADHLFVTMYADSFTACTGQSSGGNQLILSVPTTPGDYELSFDLSATFYLVATGENLITTQGRLKVDQLTASAVVGGANVHFDGGDSVSGQFQITICP